MADNPNSIEPPDLSGLNERVRDDAIDPMQLRVEFDSEIQFSRRQSGAETSYVGQDLRTGKFYRFGAAEYHVVTLLDGSRTLAEVADRVHEDGLLWNTVDVVKFASELCKYRIAIVRKPETGKKKVEGGESPAVAQQDTGRPVNDAKRSSVTRVVMMLLARVLTLRFPLADGDRIATKLMPVLGFAFTRIAYAMWIVLVLSGIAVVWEHADAFALEVRRIFDQQLWLVLALVWCAMKLVHECGHAICAKSHGVRVGKMGVMLFLMAPLAYVDVTGAWKLPRRRDRIAIALAGSYFELAIGALAAWIWWLAPTGFAKHFAAQVFLVAGPATLLVNLNPLLRLDGYYVLSDLTGIPNLRAVGRARLIGIINRFLFGFKVPESIVTGWKLDFALIHAICSVLFQFVWMSGLILAVSSWARGLGIAIATVAVLVWGVVPLVSWMHRVWTFEPMESLVLNVYQRRLIAICAVVCVVAQYLAVSTSPFSRRVPVVVQFHDEQIARAPVDAFVSAVYVRCGERVRQGDLLVELDQPELLLSRNQLFDQYELEVAKSVQLRRQRKIALADSAIEKAESMKRQLHQIDQQLDSMRIVAKRGGKITSPMIDRLLGRYVSQGDELLRVSDPQEKEVLAVVAEADIDAYNQAASQGTSARIRLRGGGAIRTALRPLQPSASQSLPHPALSASVGGPLAVQSFESSERTELVTPHLKSVLPLDALTSLAVKSGQVGRLTIPDDRTLISRVWQHVRPKLK